MNPTETRITPHQPNAGRIMITDGGPHPPEAWARVTAEHIAPLNSELSGARYVSALKLQMDIIEALTPHHANVQHAERNRLTANPPHHETPLDADKHVDEAVNSIIAAAAGTEWEEHFAQDDVLAMIRHELGVHFRTAQSIERSWCADGKAGVP